MEYNYLSRNCGLKVSAICLGGAHLQRDATDSFWTSAKLDKETSFKILDRFVELGGNFIDTSNAYSEGQSEEIIGEWMKERDNRRDMVIATKVYLPLNSVPASDPRRPNSYGLSRKHILEAVEGSLKRLKTDYIDLYQIHWPDPGTPIAEVVRTMDELVLCGKVRYPGACKLSGWQMQKLVDVAEKLGYNPWSYYSLLGRSCEQESFLVCKNEGLGLLPWGALVGGALTGKYRKGDKVQSPKSQRPAETKPKIPFGAFPSVEQLMRDEKYWTLRDVMDRIAEKHGRSASHVAFRWLLQTPLVSSAIVGAASVEQLEEAAGATGWKLTQHEMAALNEVSSTELPYPYRQQALFQGDRIKSPAYA